MIGMKEVGSFARQKLSDVLNVSVVLFFRHVLYEVIDILGAVKFSPVDETIARDVVFDICRAPINGHCARSEAIEDFFCDVSINVCAIFVTKRESISF